MALARTYAVALAGVEGHVIEVEADIENGLYALLLVGLPDRVGVEPAGLRGDRRHAGVARRTSWGCGPAPAGRARSSG
jgi:hypothetical protein